MAAPVADPRARWKLTSDMAARSFARPSAFSGTAKTRATSSRASSRTCTRSSTLRWTSRTSIARSRTAASPCCVTRRTARVSSSGATRASRRPISDLHQKLDAPLDLPYLYRAVTNRCLTLLRDEANRARLLERRDQGLAPAARTRCDDTVIGRDLLVKLVRELDEPEGEVLMYRYLDDM